MQETTTSESEIASAVHGSVIGAPSHAVRCDYCDQPLSVKDRLTVQYECARIVAFDGVDEHLLPEGWFDDMLRCGDCELSTLELPTRGYAEALVDVDLVTVDSVTVLDGNHLELVDASASDDGETLGGFPPVVLHKALLMGDWGQLRRPRLRALADELRGVADDGLVDRLEILAGAASPGASGD